MIERLEFFVGKELGLERLGRRLVEMGYVRHARVSDTGEFAIRGAVADIFPFHFSLPIRLDFDADEVASIHTFDPSSGKPLEAHRMVVILPSLSKRKASKIITASYESPVDPFVDINQGDFVVHVLHGIARYRGLKSLKNHEGFSESHFILEFADKNILYVPTRDLNFIQRYTAFGKIRPVLSKMGTKGWERQKARTEKGVFSFASEMLAMQAKRQALKGHAYAKDTEWQKKIEHEFPYEETPDQARAAEEVKKDLESLIPMDRLICGDVGYGKTEVALRAAFKVVMEGKQVAILVPTTLLAEQHAHTFGERMKNFPVVIRMLSRFQSKSNEKQILEEIRDGRCDIVIGTHRLLSPDIAFKDLGLVVIDEEQRFGVRHKERLKRLRLLVDVLTLTATPIPRTLYLSLVGAKDLSTINTPPRGRLPIKTIVSESSDTLIREAIQKELSRKGQTFFIHNRVNGIEAVAKKIKMLAPEARVAVGHGQMPSKALERVMADFIEGRVDVLVCTTIVESGIDIPNANTLIVHHADKFGLSELYQLRGRVGRFDRPAFAYFLILKGMTLTEESRKRLDAIEKFTHLGSGFNVAMQDLEIRGAGNILGTEQHGDIATVGFDLYCRMLKTAVQKISSEGKLLR